MNLFMVPDIPDESGLAKNVEEKTTMASDKEKKVIPCCVLTELKRLMANTREQLNCIGSDDMSC